MPRECPRCIRWEDRYDRLVQEMVAMKRDGFLPPNALAAPAPAFELPQEIHAAISQVAFDSVTRRGLYEKATMDLRAGVPAEEVAQRIQAGEEIAG